MKKSDVLIVGTGIAGLSLALQLNAKNKGLKIILLTKDEPNTTNTSLAQGGLAVVCDRLTDSFEEHIQDTLVAGQGKCDPKVVEIVVKSASQRLQELIKWGAEFDADPKGKLDLALEGGHSHNRVVHYKDKTGWHIQDVLWNKIKSNPAIEVIAHALAVEVVKKNVHGSERAIGLTFLDKDKQFSSIFASHIILATGGSGQVFQYTSNPEIATGDGIAIAHRAGVSIKDMHYVQFHPTALYEKGKGNLFLLSEALRGFGGHVVNAKEERFLFQYDVRGELATRDIVSKAITEEIAISGEESVYLDLRHIDGRAFENSFPTISSHLSEKAICFKTDLIPIVPVAHYQCGGIEVDVNGRTSLKNLYAIGECSRTGLHGANRLASNSLIEALVYAFNVAGEIDRNPQGKIITCPLPTHQKQQFADPTVLETYKRQIKKKMDFDLLNHTTERKKSVLTELEKIHSELAEYMKQYGRCKEYCELENRLNVAIVILTQSCESDLNGAPRLKSEAAH